MALCLLLLHVSAVWWFFNTKELRQQARHTTQTHGHTNSLVSTGRGEGAGEGEETEGRQLDLLAHRANRRITIGGKSMAAVGYGTAALGEYTKPAVLSALKVGYTHFDTAMAREWYREDLVGEAIAEAGVDRETLFLTTKLHPKDLGTQSTAAAIAGSLAALRTGYINLLLIHYPHCFASLCKGSEGSWQDAWRVMEASVAEGTVRAIGVSNFNVRELAELVNFAKIAPAVVQTHSDPLAPNLEVQLFCKEHDIQFEAYSSLGTQHVMRNGGKNPVLTHPVVTRLATKYSVSPAVVVLSWGLHHGQV